MTRPSIGEIWIVAIPVIYYDENSDITVQIQRRPVLVLDDGRGLIVEEDKRNFHVFKLTTQNDPYKRMLIKNWKQLGLRYKSYVRIEIPIKIEAQQFQSKITEIPPEELLEYYKELYNIINIEALEKMVKSDKIVS